MYMLLIPFLWKTLTNTEDIFSFLLKKKVPIKIKEDAISSMLKIKCSWYM